MVNILEKLSVTSSPTERTSKLSVHWEQKFCLNRNTGHGCCWLLAITGQGCCWHSLGSAPGGMPAMHPPEPERGRGRDEASEAPSAAKHARLRGKRGGQTNKRADTQTSEASLEPSAVAETHDDADTDCEMVQIQIGSGWNLNARDSCHSSRRRC